MNIQIVNLLLFVLIIAAMLFGFVKKPGANNSIICYIKNHYILLIVLLIFNTLSFTFTLNKTKELYIERPKFYEDEKTYSFSVNDEKNSGEVELSVRPVRIKKEEVMRLMDNSFAYFDEHLKGDNASLDEVKGNINVELPYEEFPFEIKVRPSDYRVVNESGEVRNDVDALLEQGFSNEEILSGIGVVVNITLIYEDITKSKDYELTVFSPDKNAWEENVDAVTKLYKDKEEKSSYDESFELPSSYKNVSMAFSDNSGKKAISILVIGIVVVVLLGVKELEDKKNNDLLIKRNLLLSYPWFINELVLFLGAGMQIKRIFKMMVDDYKKKTGDDYRLQLIEGLGKALNDFDIGMSEGEIYYRLGRRLKLPCYVKVMTLLEQNVTKGSKGMVSLLEQEERNAMTERINLAKQRGEEAGTKLLGPMILLLLIVMLVIMIPAFLSFS
ncbi:MAG: hypothetical protein K6G76_03420 [Lachnospiraceae bacterium]|nr:hypothetical protein [Lachnospiraceae bacterium]